MKLLGIILIVLGAIGILWGGFSYVKDRDTVDLGVAEVVVEEKGRVTVPPIIGVVLLVAGGAILGASRKRAA